MVRNVCRLPCGTDFYSHARCTAIRGDICPSLLSTYRVSLSVVKTCLVRQEWGRYETKPHLKVIQTHILELWVSVAVQEKALYHKFCTKTDFPKFSHYHHQSYYMKDALGRSKLLIFEVGASFSTVVCKPRHALLIIPRLFPNTFPLCYRCENRRRPLSNSVNFARLVKFSKEYLNCSGILA